MKNEEIEQAISNGVLSAKTFQAMMSYHEAAEAWRNVEIAAELLIARAREKHDQEVVRYWSEARKEAHKQKAECRVRVK